MYHQKHFFLTHGDKKLSLQKPLVMGILNVTPDSFSDGGKFVEVEKAVERAFEIIEEGADIIDIGGESSGPDSTEVPAEIELQRILPVLQKLRAKSDVWISVDTYKAEVAKIAIENGADIINDVTALRGDPKMAETLAESDVPIVLMYSKDPSSRTTRRVVHYENVIREVSLFFEERIQFGVSKGIDRKRFILDPGMGAFVSMEAKYSLQILKNLRDFERFDLPILIGASRKSMIGQVLDVGLNERKEGGLACAGIAVLNGAHIVRTHDVKETRRFLDMVHAILEA